MSTHANDLTQGGILRKILKVAVPIMATQLLQMTYNLTDMFWLGRSRDAVTSVAASGLAGMFLWLGMALMLFGRMGAEIGVSQSLGAKNKEAALGYAQQSTRIGLALGSVYGLILLTLAGPLVSLMRVREEAVFTAAAAYLRIVGLGIPLTYISSAISGGFNGAGISRLTFWANASGLAINMVLDPLMIQGMGWGVQGAALATLIAQSIVCLILIWFAKRHPARPFENFRLLGRFDREKVRQIFRWGLPVSLESGAFSSLAMLVTGMVASQYGANALAVQRVGSQIESLSWLIGGGFSSGVAAFIGQNFGAGKFARIRRGYRLSLGALLMWEVFVMAVLIFLGCFLFSLFLNESEALLDMGRDYLMILAGCQLFAALEGVSSGTFRGMGKTLPPSVCSISSNILRPFLCWALSRRLGLNGFWLGITLSASLRGAAMYIWYILDERKLPHHNREPEETLPVTGA